MNTPHKHAALIHAWADGDEIEFRCFNGQWARDLYPTWHEDCAYRIKPRIEKRRYRVALVFAENVGFFTANADDEIDVARIESDARFHSWLTDWVEYEVEVKP